MAFNNHYVTVLDNEEEPYRIKISIRKMKKVDEKNKILVENTEIGHNYLVLYDMNANKGV